MPYSGIDDASLPTNVKEMDADARRRWVATWNAVYADCTGGGGTADDCEGKAFAVANGTAKRSSPLPSAVIGPYDGIFTHVHRAEDGRVHWRTTCSDDGVDRYATRMTTDLHEDFIRNAEGMAGMPYLTIAHYNQIARVGRATKLYRDGRRLKAEGYFFTDEGDDFTRQLAEVAAGRALEEAALMPSLRTIKTSIGFDPQAAEAEDLGVMAYTRGILPEIAMTSYPGNSRMDFSAERSDEMEKRALSPEFMREDATTIVGEELADELDKRLRALMDSKVRADGESALELLYRSAQKVRAAVPTHKGGRKKEVGAWDGDAAVGRARKAASSDGSGDADKMNWGRYRTYFATYDPENEETFGAYGFPHHDVDADGTFLSRAGMIAAGNAAAGARQGAPNADAQKHLGPHYAEFDMTAPWNRQRSNMAHRLEDIDDLRTLESAGMLPPEAVQRGIDAFADDLMHGHFKLFEDIETKAIPGGYSYARKGSKPVDITAPSLLARVGRKLQGKKLSELEAVVKTLAALVDWAKADESDGNDEAKRYEPREIDPAQPFRAAMTARMEHGTEPDASLMDMLAQGEMCEMVMTAGWTLMDIIMANFEGEDMPLAERLQNVQNASGEFLQVVNALMMQSFGGGRSLADNNNDMKSERSQKGVKPEGAEPTVNPDGVSHGRDLTGFDDAVSRLRQVLVEGGDIETVQAELDGLPKAIEQTLGPPTGTSEEYEALVGRVAGVEVGLNTIMSRLDDLIDSLQEPRNGGGGTASVRTYAPRRQSYAPGPPPTATERKGSRPLKISEAAQLNMGRRYP